MMKRSFYSLTIFLIAAIAFQACSGSGNTQEKPNIVFILADDLGWTDLSCMGSTFYHTPNIDRLAEGGVKFMNAYATNPVCSPTRASLLTGKWTARLGLFGAICHIPAERTKATLPRASNPKNKMIPVESATRLDTSYITYAEHLKNAGYVTGHFGKWHLGPEPFSPLEQGFDMDIPHSSAPSPLPNGWFAPWPVWKNQGTEGDHLEDRMADEAVRFIQENKEESFLLNYWSFTPHTPINAKEELIKKYEESKGKNKEHKNAVYAAMIESLDDAVGKIVQTLEEEGILDKTIIIFMSDNGGLTHRQSKFVHESVVGMPPTSNAPLRGGKAEIYEGGLRVPFIISWNGIKHPGTMDDHSVVSSVDIYPTLMDLTGIKTGKEIIDGKSLLPLLKGKKAKKNEFFCHLPVYFHQTKQIPATSIRKDDWKLIRFYGDGENGEDRYELYNLSDDISEKKNLSEEDPKKMNELISLMNTYLEDTESILPEANPKYKNR